MLAPEPSDAERATLPNATRDYIGSLEAYVKDLEALALTFRDYANDMATGSLRGRAGQSYESIGREDLARIAAVLGGGPTPMTEPETNPVTSEETHVISKGGRHDAAGQHPAIPPLRRGDMASSTADKELADGLISLGMEPGQAVAYAAEHSASVNATSLGERLYRALYNEGATPLSSYSPAIQRGFERGARAFLKSLTRANPHLIAAAPDGYAAAKDALAGWRYIREHHGDLYGVGWDRVEKALADFIAKAEDRA